MRTSSPDISALDPSLPWRGMSVLRHVLGVLCLIAVLGGLSAVAPSAVSAHPNDSLNDSDHDMVDDPPFGPDNCAGEFAASNRDQRDTDGDGRGDACDSDDDADGVDDAVDNCRVVKNDKQEDLDGDGQGDPCDNDDDGDGVFDTGDNCPVTPNPDQADADRDRIGDSCEKAEPTTSTASSAPAPAPAPEPAPAGGGSTGGGTSPAAPTDPGGGSVSAAAPRDTRAPSVRLTVGARHRLGELGAGLAVAVRCSEACTVLATLIPKRGAALGKGDASLGAAGSTYAFVTLNKATRRRLQRARTMVAVVRVVVTDAAGNRTTAKRSITIRR